MGYTSSGFNSQEEKESKVAEFRKKMNARRENVGIAAKDYKNAEVGTSKESVDTPDTTTPDVNSSMMAAGTNLATGGSKTDALSAGLMAAPNPYAKAAGLGLAVISSGKKRRQKEKVAEAQAEMKRRSNVMAAMQNFGAGIGQM